MKNENKIHGMKVNLSFVEIKLEINQSSWTFKPCSESTSRILEWSQVMGDNYIVKPTV
jgi:hypothetical protein